MTEAIWVALIGLAGVLAGSVGLWFGRRKLKAEAAQIVTDAAISLIEPLQKRIESLENVVTVYQATMDEWQIGVEKLQCQIIDLKAVPVWTPPPVPHVLLWRQSSKDAPKDGQ